MRTSFINSLCDLAAEDERIFLICGDLGFSVLEGFASRFPSRYLNAGVAEQNMTGMAAGLAMTGRIVFTYSIANFPVMRCLEQIRNDVCYHNLNVKIVAVGGGLSYGPQGYTHHGVEDLAVMRVLPNMAVLAPADPVETRLATRALIDRRGPCYLRLGKAGEPIVYSSDPDFEIGRAITVRPGTDVTLITTGAMLEPVLNWTENLLNDGLSVRILSMHTVQPLDEDAIRCAVEETGRIVTIEEHGLGGLGSAVAEYLATAGSPVNFAIVRLRREGAAHAGSQTSLRGYLGVSAETFQNAVRRVMDPEAARLARSR
jgi:transketolase